MLSYFRRAVIVEWLTYLTIDLGVTGLSLSGPQV